MPVNPEAKLIENILDLKTLEQKPPRSRRLNQVDSSPLLGHPRFPNALRAISYTGKLQFSRPLSYALVSALELEYAR